MDTSSYSNLAAGISDRVYQATRKASDLLKSKDKNMEDFESITQLYFEIINISQELEAIPGLKQKDIKQQKEMLQSLGKFAEEISNTLLLVVNFQSDPAVSQLFNEIINSKEKGHASTALLEKLKQLNSKINEAIGKPDSSPEEKKALQKLQSCVKEFNTSIILERAEALASPILTSKKPGKATFEAFKVGHEPAMLGLMTIDQIGRQQKVSAAPKNVTPLGNPKANSEVQKAITFLFDNYEDTTLQLLQKGKDLYIQFSDKSGNKLEIKFDDWKNADLSKIKLTEKQLKNYENLLLNYSTTCRPGVTVNDPTFPDPSFFSNRESPEQQGKISYAEQLAINIYSSNKGCSIINESMRGFTTNNDRIKEGMLHSIVIGQALPKLPDFVDPDGRVYLWRGEGTNFKTFKTLDHLEEVVNSGGLKEASYGFTSASFEKPSDSFFNPKSPAGQMIKATGGKNINPYSQYHVIHPGEEEAVASEREILFPRGNFIYSGQWTVKTDNDVNLTVFIVELEQP